MSEADRQFRVESAGTELTGCYGIFGAAGNHMAPPLCRCGRVHANGTGDASYELFGHDFSGTAHFSREVLELRHAVLDGQDGVLVVHVDPGLERKIR